MVGTCLLYTSQVQEITEQIREMCILVNHELSQDMQEKLAEAKSCEESVLGKQILEQLEDNLKIAKEDRIPICQDTGMAVIFLEIGQDVHLEGGNVEEAINEGVRQGYVPVSYTHLDVYKRQVLSSQKVQKSSFEIPSSIFFSWQSSPFFRRCLI